MQSVPSHGAVEIRRQPDFAAVVTHNLMFSFTRTAPCATTSTTRTCIEIVVHGTPEADSLEETLEKVARTHRLRRTQRVHYSSATGLRLITDPDTMLPHGADMRRYAYLRLSEAGPNSELIESEKTLSVSTYQ
jgi:hypothetical protein